MDTRIADKLDVKKSILSCSAESQRDLGRELIFHMIPLLLPLPVSECSEAHSRGGQFCSDLRKLRDLQKWQPSQSLRRGVGKVTGDRNLKAEGKAEKKTGKVQQRIGHAKEAVADLKGQLAD
jgi:uncharacterized protein YjbJ (UPF0337 family)